MKTILPSHPICPFCDLTLIAKDKTFQALQFYQDDTIKIAHSKCTKVPGYVIISPLRHITGFDQLDEQELARITLALRTCVKILREEYSAEKVYLCSFGEIVEHFHLHVFPRYNWMKDIAEVVIDANLDGARLFSYAQKHCKSSDLEVATTDPKFLAMSNFFRQQLADLFKNMQ